LEFHRNDIRNGINASVHSSIDDFFSSFEKVYNHHVTDTNIDLNWKSSLKTSFKYSSEMVSRWFRKHIAQVRPELHWSQVKQMVRDRFASTALTGTQAVKLASMSLLYKESFKCYVDRFTLNLSALEGIPDYVLAVAMFYNTLPRCIKQSLYSKLKSIKGDDCADHVPGTWKEAVPLFHNLSRTMNPVMDKYYRSFTSIHEYGTTISVGKTLELESHSKKRGSEEDLDFDKSKPTKDVHINTKKIRVCKSPVSRGAQQTKQLSNPCRRCKVVNYSKDHTQHCKVLKSKKSASNTNSNPSNNKSSTSTSTSNPSSNDNPSTSSPENSNTDQAVTSKIPEIINEQIDSHDTNDPMIVDPPAPSPVVDELAEFEDDE